MNIPNGSIMVSTVLVVEYMTPDGELHIKSETYDSAGEDLDLPKVLEMLEDARMDAIAPRLAHKVAAFCLADDDDAN